MEYAGRGQLADQGMFTWEPVKNLMEACRFLAEGHDESDGIWCFGFSSDGAGVRLTAGGAGNAAAREPHGRNAARRDRLAASGVARPPVRGGGLKPFSRGGRGCRPGPRRARSCRSRG